MDRPTPLSEIHKHEEFALGVRAELFTLETLSADIGVQVEPVDATCKKTRRESVVKQLARIDSMKTMVTSFEDALLEFSVSRFDGGRVGRANKAGQGERGQLKRNVQNRAESAGDDYDAIQNVLCEQTIYADNMSRLTFFELQKAFLAKSSGELNLFDLASLKRALIVEADLRTRFQNARGFKHLSIDQLLDRSELFMLTLPELSARRMGEESVMMTRILSQAHVAGCVEKWLHDRPFRTALKIQRILASFHRSLCKHEGQQDRVVQVATVHALWELALHKDNHPMLLGLFSWDNGKRHSSMKPFRSKRAALHLIQTVLHYLSSSPCVERGVDTERSLHYVSCGYIFALVQSPATVQSLLTVPETKDILVESLLVALKRVPENSWRAGEAHPGAKLLLGALCCVVKELTSHTALFRSNKAYLNCLFGIVSKELDPECQLLALQVLVRALTSLPSFEENSPMWSKLFEIVFGRTFVVLPTSTSDVSVSMASVLTLRETQLTLARSILAYVRETPSCLDYLDSVSPETLFCQLLDLLTFMLTDTYALFDDTFTRQRSQQLQVFLQTVQTLIFVLCEAVQNQHTKERIETVRINWKYWTLFHTFDTTHIHMLRSVEQMHATGSMSRNDAQEQFKVMEQALLAVVIELGQNHGLFLQSLRHKQTYFDRVFGARLISQRQSNAAKALHAHIIYLSALAGYKYKEKAIGGMVETMLGHCGDSADAAVKEWQDVNVSRYLAAAIALSANDDQSRLTNYYMSVLSRYQSQAKQDQVVSCFLNHGLHMVASNPAALAAWAPEKGLEDPLIASLLQNIVQTSSSQALVPLLQTLQRLVGQQLDVQDRLIKQSLKPKEVLTIQETQENLDKCARLAVSLSAKADSQLAEEGMRLLGIVASKSLSFDLAPSLTHSTTLQTVIRLVVEQRSSKTLHLAIAALLGLATFHFDFTIQVLEAELQGVLGLQQDADFELKFIRICLYFLRAKDVELRACGAYLYSRHRIADLSLHEYFRQEKGWSALLSIVRQADNVRVRSLGLLALIQATEVDKQNQRAAGSKNVLQVLAILLRDKQVPQQTKVLIGALIRNLLKHANNRPAIYRMELFLRGPNDAFSDEDHVSLPPAASTEKRAAAKLRGSALPKLCIATKKAPSIKASYEDWLVRVQQELENNGTNQQWVRVAIKGVETKAADPLLLSPSASPRSPRDMALKKQMQIKLQLPVARLWARSGSFCAADSNELLSPQQTPHSPSRNDRWSPQPSAIKIVPPNGLNVTVEHESFQFYEPGQYPDRSMTDDSASQANANQQKPVVPKTPPHDLETSSSNKIAEQEEKMQGPGAELEEQKKEGGDINPPLGEGPSSDSDDEHERDPETLKRMARRKARQQILRDKIKNQMRQNFKAKQQLETDQSDESKSLEHHNASLGMQLIDKPESPKPTYHERYKEETYGKSSLAMFQAIPGGRTYKNLPTYELPNGSRAYFYHSHDHEPLSDLSIWVANIPANLKYVDPMSSFPCPSKRPKKLQKCLHRIRKLSLSSVEAMRQQSNLPGLLPSFHSLEYPAYSEAIVAQLPGNDISWTGSGIVVDDPVQLMLAFPELTEDQKGRQRGGGGPGKGGTGRISVFGCRLWRQDTSSLGTFGRLSLSTDLVVRKRRAFQLASSVFSRVSSKRRVRKTIYSKSRDPEACQGQATSSLMNTGFRSSWEMLASKPQFQKFLQRSAGFTVDSAKVNDLKTLLNANYDFLHNVFRYYGALGQGTGSFTLQLHEFCSLLKDIGILKNRDQVCLLPFTEGKLIQVLESDPTKSVIIHQLNTGSTDTIFMVANKTPPSMEMLQKAKSHFRESLIFNMKANDALQMFEFIDALLRLAHQAAIGDKSPKSRKDHTTPTPKMVDMVEGVLLAMRRAFRNERLLTPEKFREERMFNWAVNEIVEENLPMLKSLFKRYCDCVSRASRGFGACHNRSIMSLIDWIQLVEDLGLFHAHFNHRDATCIFAMSTLHDADTFKDWRDTVTVDFAQFLECICRLADAFFLPTDKEILSMGIDLDQGDGGFDIGKACKSGIVGFYRLVSQTNLWSDFDRPGYSYNATHLQFWRKMERHEDAPKLHHTHDLRHVQQRLNPIDSGKNFALSTAGSSQDDDVGDTPVAGFGGDGESFYDKRALDFKLSQLFKLVLASQANQTTLKSSEKRDLRQFLKNADLDERNAFKHILEAEFGKEESGETGRGSASPSRPAVRKRYTIDVNVAERLVVSDATENPARHFAQLPPETKKNLLILSHHACEIVRDAARRLGPNNPKRNELFKSKDFVTDACIRLMRVLRSQSTIAEQQGDAALNEDKELPNEDLLNFKNLRLEDKQRYLIIVRKAINEYLSSSSEGETDAY